MLQCRDGGEKNTQNIKWSKNKIIIIGLIVVIATVGVVYAATQYWSNTVTINPQLISLSLVANTTSPLVGETVRFTATLSTGASGVTVNFYVNNTVAGASVTTAGVATWDHVIGGDLIKVNATCNV